MLSNVIDVSQQFPGFKTTFNNMEVVEFADYIFLAVKPQVVPDILKELKGRFNTNKVLISICAGVTIETITNALGSEAKVVRVMPNTPALYGVGASAMCASSGCLPEEIEVARTLMSACGTCHVVNEKLMDAVTGLSGSGPAYVYMFIEALSDAGVKGGLPRDVATGLAVQTVLGAATMVKESGLHPAVLKEQVTSPGGTTIHGVAALEDNGFRKAVIAGVDAARIRSEELGKAAAEASKKH
eukprot:GDKH01008141.1.p1 GENE.GDKH01008141.1~~GDKH01008141.1.p1  ORF type:complete len:280 (-),score=47.54 GDKH01008141.1:57-782(-)